MVLRDMVPMPSLRAWNLVFSVCVGMGLGFNIETDYFVMHRGPAESKFGFSLAMHRDTTGSWVLVGAPEAETLQPEIQKGGAVYRCHPRIPDDCEAIPFDKLGNHWEAGRQVDNKSMQWFGASVISRSGVIVACAPRYVWFSVKKNRREPVGNCFISTGRDSQAYQMYSPCMTSSWGYHRQGSCQAGFGTALTKDGNGLFVGAVGSFYWQGQVFYQDLLNKQEALATLEGPQRDDMSYLGYSMTIGEFNGDDKEDIAVGMPRGNDLMGQVVIFDGALTVLYNITGDQIGSYFGYAVTAGDFNGDGRTDVAVGAPWYTDPKASVDFEVGGVFVFTQMEQHNFQQSANLKGQKSRSHFGISVASLGDLNLDKHDDLAVGAPYDGDEGRGAVYIFLGGPKGITKKPSQVLKSEDLTKVNMATFGWSLAAGDDMDDNSYPDLVVGAYNTNKAAVFRTRPVVKVEANIKFKSETGIIDHESLECSLQDQTSVACVALQYCLTYNGTGVPSELDMEVTLELDTQVDLSRRMFFLNKEDHNVITEVQKMRKLVPNCHSVFTYLIPELPDKLTPLVAEMKYRLLDRGPAEPRETLRPMLEPLPPSERDVQKTRIILKNNCGNDNICIPDLATRVKVSIPEYVLGSKENIMLIVEIENSGEDAFQTKTIVRVPRGVTFSKFEVKHNSDPDLSPICSLDNKDDSERVICDIGNPLPARAKVILHLVFQPIPETVNSSALEFHVTTTSANEEGEEESQALALPVTVRSDIDIKGISWPDGPFDYNVSLFGKHLVGERPIQHEKEVGPEVMHVYHVTNQGPSDLPGAHLYLLWPTRTLTGDPLLYLLDTRLESRFTKCEKVADTNYLGLTVDEASYENLIVTPILDAEEGEASLSSASGHPTDAVADNLVLREQQHRRRRRHNHHHTVSSSSSSHAHRRHRREEEGGVVEGSGLGVVNIEKELSCGPTNCTRVRCTISPFRKDDNVVLRVRSRLWVDTIEKIGMSEVKISSRLVVIGTDGKDEVEGSSSAKPFHTNTPGHHSHHLQTQVGMVWRGTVTTIVRTSTEEQRTSLKWLVICGSILIGLLLLAILCAILWSIGFFKRNRPHDKHENEPLNSNGYYGNENGKS
ncbi:integrin alpha-PS2-like isoform X2 [Macrobrachium rosenbergii]|uniref:integrin alpha-PS2-like isoform X2 n=1 Tax=Macrobrachium rosenbergii TaxID=79674 RepID=UPI0034D75056